MRLSRGKPRARGFSLVEIMVALVVICVGLLGIAKIQALAISNTTSSRLRALAAFEAAGLAAAMHANRQYWAGTLGTNPPATVTLANGVIASSDAALQAQAIQANVNACLGDNSGVAKCAAVNLAGSDLVNWVNDMTQLLPNPTATIACPPVVGNVPSSCTIQISWREQAVAVTRQATNMSAAQCAQQGAGQCFEVPTYTLYVEP